MARKLRNGGSWPCEVVHNAVIKTDDARGIREKRDARHTSLESARNWCRSV